MPTQSNFFHVFVLCRHSPNFFMPCRARIVLNDRAVVRPKIARPKSHLYFSCLPGFFFENSCLPCKVGSSRTVNSQWKKKEQFSVKKRRNNWIRLSQTFFGTWLSLSRPAPNATTDLRGSSGQARPGLIRSADSMIEKSRGTAASPPHK